MKINKIEHTLDEIIKIDSKAKELEKEMKEMQNNFDRKLNKEKISIERRHLKEARQRAKEMRDDILISGKSVVNTLEEKSDERIKKLEHLLNNNIKEITQSIFNQIINQL